MNIAINKLLQWLLITFLFPAIFLNAWLAFRTFQYFQPIITVIVLASLFAFILDYPVSWLEHRQLERKYAVILVFATFILIVIAAGVTLVPIVLEQFNEMVKILPQRIDASEAKLHELNQWVVNQGLPVNLSRLFSQLTDHLPEELEKLTDKFVGLAVETIDSISEALLTIVLTFYLLLDGERLWQGIFKKLPGNFGHKIKQSLQQNFQNYLIGQVVLASLVGVLMTTMFLILKVPFGLLFGLGMGLLSLIPFGDVVSLGVITSLIGLHDFWLAVKVLVIAVVIDQSIDQAIAPRLLGSFTGLRPIWVLIALLVGTYVGGLLGLVLAVPLAGVINNAIDGWNVPVSEYTNNSVQGEELVEVVKK